ERDQHRRKAASGDQPGERAGRRYDDQDLRDQRGRIDRDGPELRPGELAVDEHRDHDGVDAGETGRFGRRGQAAVNAAEDDDRRQQRPDRILEVDDDVLALDRSRDGNFLDPRIPHYVDRERDADQDAGGKAGEKQLRYRLLRRDSVDDHRDRRRS